MNEERSQIATEPGSERGFAVVFAVVFALIGCIPLLTGGRLHAWPLAIAALLLLIGAVAPRVLRGPNRLWFRFGVLLGHVVGSVVMALIWALVVVPTGLVMRLAGRDPLQRTPDSTVDSYWIERDTPPGSMRDQF